MCLYDASDKLDVLLHLLMLLTYLFIPTIPLDYVSMLLMQASKHYITFAQPVCLLVYIISFDMN